MGSDLVASRVYAVKSRITLCRGRIEDRYKSSLCFRYSLLRHHPHRKVSSQVRDYENAERANAQNARICVELATPKMIGIPCLALPRAAARSK